MEGTNNHSRLQIRAGHFITDASRVISLQLRGFAVDTSCFCKSGGNIKSYVVSLGNEFKAYVISEYVIGINSYRTMKDFVKRIFTLVGAMWQRVFKLPICPSMIEYAGILYADPKDLTFHSQIDWG